MKNIFKISLVIISLSTRAQNPLYIPDTLSGASFSLTLKKDSAQFFPGKITQTNAFNNYKYLGPTLILNNGSNVNVTVNNQLPDTTTIHWHGLHVAAINDGGPHTMIMPGGVWNPQFTVMNAASTYWYHPHMHRQTGAQVMKGAAGMIIVRDSTEATLALPRTYGVDDIPLIIQSQQFDSVNQINVRGMEDSIILVNGILNPYLNIPSQVVRFRLLNAAQERSFNFGFTANKSFYVIGNDNGLLTSPVLTTRIRLSPGERAEVLIDLSGMNGQTLYLMNYGSELPMGVQGGPTMPMPSWSPPMDSPLNGADFNMLQLNIAAQTLNPITSVPAALATYTPYLATQATITRTLNLTADSITVMDGPFYFNDSLFDMMRIDYNIPLDNIEIWELINTTMVAHPFHIHDVHFYILDRDGNPPAAVEKGRKDVVLVQPNETVRFIAKFTDFADTLTPYMFHCHILMHEDDGMMGQFVVSPHTSGIKSIDQKNEHIFIYPNPASDNIFVALNNFNEKEFTQLKLIDAQGVERYLTTVSDKQIKINTNSLSPGFYTVLLIQGDHSFRKKIIIE